MVKEKPERDENFPEDTPPNHYGRKAKRNESDLISGSFYIAPIFACRSDGGTLLKAYVALEFDIRGT